MQRHEIIERLGSVFRGIKEIRELEVKHWRPPINTESQAFIVEPGEFDPIYTISISFTQTRRGRRSLFLLLYGVAKSAKHNKDAGAAKKGKARKA